MSKKFEALINQFKSSSNLSKEDLLLFEKLEIGLNKEVLKYNFKIAACLNSEKTTINFLNKSVKELEEIQKNVEQKNYQLETQRETILQSYQQIEIAFKELEEFTYFASHDLKSPIRNIVSMAQLVLRNKENQLTESGEEFINNVINSAKNLYELVQDTLEYSKIDKVENNQQEVDLNDLVDQIKVNLNKEIEESKATINFKNLPILKGNKSALTQLFQNLIENAIHYRSSKLPEIRIDSNQIGKTYIFHVIDNGQGLDEEYKDKIFDAFQRIDKSRSGSGLGLAICMKVVKMHGGKIFYKTNSKGGTTFSFTLQSESTQVNWNNYQTSDKDVKQLSNNQNTAVA